MKRLSAATVLFLLALGASAQGSRTLFDFDWKFSEGDAPGAQAPSFDDSRWQSVDLPHDWDISHAPEAGAPTLGGGGYYPAGTGWYRKTFVKPDGEIVSLHFEGVYQRSSVYVNGKLAGTHAYGYTPFTVDMTDFLKDGENSVAVMVDNSLQPNCRWYSGSGIYRHVWLETCGLLHLERDGVFITTPDVSPSRASVNIEVSVRNDSRSERTVSVSALGSTKNLTLAPLSTGTVTLRSTVGHPELWSPDHPYLYSAEVKLAEGGKTIDSKTVRYGIRSFSYSASDGFCLNGKPILLNGACVHHDDGALGSAAFDDAEIRKVRLMKEAGFNLIRTSHNPTTSAFLNACDSLGMLVIGEAFDGWRSMKTQYDYSTLLDSCFREDIGAMVMRDRNHPSIICWSIGNEVIERKDIRVIQTAKDMKKVILSCDSTRPVTEALCAWDNDWEIYDPHAEVLDIVGYNYMMHKAEGDHLRVPERIMWQTESYPRDAFLNWNRTFDNPYIIGDIVWTGLDYLGEASIGRFYYEGAEPVGEHYQIEAFPWHGAYCGDVDITGWRKPVSHYREMLWNPQTAPEIYLAVKEPDGYHGKILETQWSVWPTWESWNWPGHEGKDIEAEVYTTAPAVNLYLNGSLVATRKVDRSTGYKAVISLPYAPGELKAVAVYAEGREGASSVLRTAGAPAKIRLVSETASMRANGQDLCYVVIEVLDKDGNTVPDAAVPLDIKVSGAGSLLAAVSADMKDSEPYVSSHVTTWCGRAMVVVRAARRPGTLKIEASGALKGNKISVKVK